MHGEVVAGGSLRVRDGFLGDVSMEVLFGSEIFVQGGVSRAFGGRAPVDGTALLQLQTVPQRHSRCAMPEQCGRKECW